MQEKYSKIITDFLLNRPAISVNYLEKELNLPQSTIGQALNGNRLIPEKHIFPILCFLVSYGLQVDGYNLSFDSESCTISGRKWAENIDTIEEGSGFAYIVKEYRILFSDYSDLF